MKKVKFILISLFVVFCFGPALSNCLAEEDVNVVNNFIKVKEKNCKRTIVTYQGSMNIPNNDINAGITILNGDEPLPFNEGEILVIETVSVDARLDNRHPSPVPCALTNPGGLGTTLATWPMTATFASFKRAHISTQQLRLYIPYEQYNFSVPPAIVIQLESDEFVPYDHGNLSATVYGYIVSEKCRFP